MSESAISIKGLLKRYGAVTALGGVDLEIPKGAFFGLLGPNGAGKSTLINTIAGLSRPDQGTVSVMGHDVIDDYQAARRCLGVVPQELVFDAFFTVREVLRIQSGYFGLGRENYDWIEQLLYELRLQDKAESNMRALSGGMKRRVLIAQALVHRPDIVILDEPTAGVDIEVRQLLWALIRRLHGEGHTIILTTHYLEEAETLCEHIAILNMGRVVALDSKQGLLSRGEDQVRSIEFVVDRPVNELPETIRSHFVRTGGQSCIVETRGDCGPALMASLEAFQAHGVSVTEVRTERPDLEDVFMDLTRATSS
ncbi:MAG: ATP-binding cassette domain-containing protein [Gammaproteobacteria bacterium]|nr:ATP-binding cassette domain-containing protein [Gammaproteobacteria bacterium]